VGHHHNRPNNINSRNISHRNRPSNISQHHSLNTMVSALVTASVATVTIHILGVKGSAKTISARATPTLEGIKMNQNERGDSDFSGIVWLVIVALAIWGGTAYFGGEREGTVKIDDCREMIELKPDTLRKYYETFTCSYNHTESGIERSAVCTRIDTDSTLFSASHACATAYVYERHLKKNGGGCRDPALPYLGYDDRCYADPQ
jgi:hypothetical protein